MKYVITGQLITRDRRGTCSRQVPTFFLESAVQGIVSCEHAQQIARHIIDPTGEHEVSVFAVRIDS